jgi:hypothetical protein
MVPFTGAMRAWAAGQILLVSDVALAAGLGLAQRSAGRVVLGAPLAVMLAALLAFFVPLVLAVAVPSLRTRAFLWAVSAVPAILWIPAIPAVFLRAGPELSSPVGVGLASAALIGAVLVIVGAGVAMIESGRRITPEPEFTGTERSAVFVADTETAEPASAEGLPAGSALAEPVLAEPSPEEAGPAEPSPEEPGPAEPSPEEALPAPTPAAEPDATAEPVPSGVDAEVALLAQEAGTAADDRDGPAPMPTTVEDLPS